MYKKLLVCLMLLLLVGCGKKDDELVLITEAGFAPYEFYENGEITGVDIEIGKEIAKELNKKLVVKDVAFDFIINEIKSGKGDIGAAGMSITDERKEQVDFSIEYVTSNQVVVTKQDSDIKSVDDIKNKTISVQLGTTADMYLHDNYKEAKIITQKKYLAAAEDVKSGKSDCIVMDKLPALELVKENKNLKIVDGILFTDKYGMVVKKGNKDLLDKVNKVLQRLVDENKIEEFIIKYSK